MLTCSNMTEMTGDMLTKDGFTTEPTDRLPTANADVLRSHLEQNPLGRIILAIDSEDIARVLAIDKRVMKAVGAIKVGNELHNSVGWSGIAAKLSDMGARGHYYDARFSETPSQMRQQMKWFNSSARSVPVKNGLVSVDVLGASDSALREAAKHRGEFMLVTETVQPSLTDEDCLKRHRRSAGQTVLDAASIAVDTDIQGVTSSAYELTGVASDVALSSLIRIATGIRVEGDDAGDHVRVTNPSDAIKMGAEMLVIGHSILQAPNGDQYGRMMRIAEMIHAA